MKHRTTLSELTMQTVKIYGAGSIGNHMANASRAMGMKVDVVDIDETALNRMKGDIYPSRYGAWDENISLHTQRRSRSADRI